MRDYGKVTGWMPGPGANEGTIYFDDAPLVTKNGWPERSRRGNARKFNKTKARARVKAQRKARRAGR